MFSCWEKIKRIYVCVYLKVLLTYISMFANNSTTQQQQQQQKLFFFDFSLLQFLILFSLSSSFLVLLLLLYFILHMVKSMYTPWIRQINDDFSLLFSSFFDYLVIFISPEIEITFNITIYKIESKTALGKLFSFVVTFYSLKFFFLISFLF